MKNLVIILSHCDTEGKIKILKDNLESLNMLNLDTMLTSHCPLSTDIQKEVNYFIYDKSNPLLFLTNGKQHEASRAVNAWAEFLLQGDENPSIKLKSFLPDAGWAVFNKIIKAADLSLPLDYDYYTIINYDVILKPSFVKQLLKPNFDGDALLSWSMQENDDYEKICENNKPMLGMGKGPGLLFSILKKETYLGVRQTISKKEYLEKDTKSNKLKHEFAEQYWGNLLEPFNSCFTEEVSVSRANTLNGESDEYNQVASSFRNATKKQFKIFFEGQIIHHSLGYNERTREGLKVFIFNKRSKEPIKFKVNNEKIIEVSSFHLEKNVRSISHLNPDGSSYSFEKERAKATKLFNEIEC